MMLQGKNLGPQIHDSLKCLYIPVQCFDIQRKLGLCSTIQFGGRGAWF